MEEGTHMKWMVALHTFLHFYLISTVLGLGHYALTQAKHKSLYIYFQFSHKHQLDKVFQLGIIGMIVINELWLTMCSKV
uniref:Putative secreted protein n=1 Tax=Ixodes ricinus TaxID=34613 RepID=A0A6B0U3W0_IXORI